ncbi:MAG: acetylxylan esterase [Oscillospiraceae bacterium]|jgi:cephalosporin-C deacetylase|nr:acetylxylan esterase [Oscillospiraceae bacterium]
MPLIDMPLEELRQYRGRNECPADLDEFWDRSIREMEALGTDCELVPAEFQAPGAECFHLWFTGVGGARVHAVFLRPEKRETRRPAVLMFHGYTGDAGSFAGKLGYVGAGYVVAALDCRGQGGLSEDPVPVRGNTFHGHIIRGLEDGPEKLYFRSVFLDCAQLARIVMALPYVDESRVAAMGGSQGGGLTLACAALTPTLNRAAPQVPFLSDYRRVWEMDLAKDAYAELTDYFRHTDPRHLREKETFTRLGYIDNHNLAHRIRCKIRMFTGLMDTICPPSTQFAAFNRIESEKEVVLYPDFGHEMPPSAEDDIMKFILEM